tara:strand:- start:11483 stop:11788 length:306 start_codon:yes stop_codon:yes gene_type:complete
MTVKNIIEQAEKMFGRQPEQYMFQLINDALDAIAAEKQHNTKEKIVDLKVKQRWYTLDDDVIDITRVEVKDTDGRYVMIPKLADPHKLLKGDTDEADDSLV